MSHAHFRLLIEALEDIAHGKVPQDSAAILKEIEEKLNSNDKVENEQASSIELSPPPVEESTLNQTHDSVIAPVSNLDSMPSQSNNIKRSPSLNEGHYVKTTSKTRIGQLDLDSSQIYENFSSGKQQAASQQSNKFSTKAIIEAVPKENIKPSSHYDPALAGAIVDMHSSSTSPDDIENYDSESAFEPKEKKKLASSYDPKNNDPQFSDGFTKKLALLTKQAEDEKKEISSIGKSRQLVCDICGKTYHHKSFMKIHMESVHKICEPSELI